MSGRDRFLIRLDQYGRTILDLDVTQKDIDTMLRKLADIPGIEYKNPLAIIFGYTISEGGRGINISKLKRTIEKLKKIPEAKEAGIEPPDLIRYARYWCTL